MVTQRALFPHLSRKICFHIFNLDLPLGLATVPLRHVRAGAQFTCVAQIGRETEGWGFGAVAIWSGLHVDI